MAGSALSSIRTAPRKAKRYPMKIAFVPADPAQTITFREVTDGEHLLAELQDLVGGDIEAVRLTRRAMTMYINETGKLERLPMNARATILAEWDNALHPGDTINGDAVLTGPMDSTGVVTPIVHNHQWWLVRFDAEQAGVL